MKQFFIKNSYHLAHFVESTPRVCPGIISMERYVGALGAALIARDGKKLK